MADRSVLVRLRADISDFQRGMRTATAETSVFERQLESADKKGGAAIDRLSGRLRLFADAAAIFGPGAVPVGGVLAAGVAGFASQLGFAAIAGGVLAGSMQGLGDALGAMNKAQLEPTEKNLEAAHDALARLSPTTRDFAEQLFALKPALVAIRDIGAESLVPGLSEAFDSIETTGPRVAGIVDSVAGALGEIAADSAASLASDRWADFFAMIEADAPQALSDMASAIGDVTHGLAEMWEKFAPLNADFSSWLVDVADGFDEWATGLSATEGFQEFVDYIRETGPQVADTAGALAGAIVQIVQATAPLAGPVLAGVEAFANAIGAIADSDLGTPIFAAAAALAAYNRALSLTQATQKRIDAGGGLFGMIGQRQGAVRSSFAAVRNDVEALGTTWATAGARTSREQARMAESAKSLRTNLGTLTKQAAITGAPIAGIALASSGAADGLGLTNTASLALMGSLAGPWGIAIGAGVGGLMDLSDASAGAREAIDGLAGTAQSGNIDALRAQIARAKDELDAMSDHRWLQFGDGIAWVTGKIGDGADKIDDAERALAELEKTQKTQEVQSRASAMAYASQVGLNVELATWAGRSTEEIKAQADALLAVDKRSQAVADSFGIFGESLNDSKVSLHGFITEMQDLADAQSNFATNAKKAARNGLDNGLILSLRDMGDEGALRMKQFANASESEIARANAAFKRHRRAVEDTLNIGRDLAGMSPIALKVQAETAPAMRDIEGLEARLRAIRDEDVFINIRQIGSTTLGPRPGVADGGTIPGDRYPYGDKGLYMLAPGEEVISNRNGQADRWRPLLKAINGGLADGGTAGKKKRRTTLEVVPQDTSAQDERDAAREERDRQREEQRQRQLDAERADREEQANRFLAAIEGQERAAQDLIDAAQEQKRSAEEVRDGWAQAMQRAGQAATAGFSSSLFGGSQQRGLWVGGNGGGKSSWRSALMGDIAGLQERGSLIAQLQDQGIKGSALEALMGGSNADISSILTSGEAGDFASLFAQREQLLGSVAAQAGQAAYGTEFAMASAQVAALGSQILMLQGQLAAITAQRPITIYEAISAQATAAEFARLSAMQGAA